LKLYRLEGGWRQQTIYADVLWIILIAVKYYCASFLSNMIAEQIVKRKKQWPFIKILKTTITQILPFSLISNPVRVDGMKISINGKINGRDRSIHYLMSKLYKDLQATKAHPVFLKVDYSLSFANSKYGVFGIKVWISRL
jgi:ribosomal protein S3